MYKNDQIRFIPGMQDWVSIRKSNNVILRVSASQHSEELTQEIIDKPFLMYCFIVVVESLSWLVVPDTLWHHGL